MKNIAIIYGGRSVEHEVSILTALHAARNVVDGNNIHMVYLTHDNRMVTGKTLTQIDTYLNNNRRLAASVKPRATTHSSHPHAIRRTRRIPGTRPCHFEGGRLYIRGFGRCLRKPIKIDAVLNCCHGGVGEDGYLAALLKIANIPHTGCDTLSAKKLMSKTETRVMLGMCRPSPSASVPPPTDSTTPNLDLSCPPQPKFISINRKDHNTQTLTRITELLPYPLIVKPDTLGSSIGITTASNTAELKAALDLAFTLDSRAIIEEYLTHTTEINCSAFFAQGKIWVSKCEVVGSQSEAVNKKNQAETSGGTPDTPATPTIFDFETKYLDTTSGFIKKSKDEEPTPPPHLAKIFEQIQIQTKQAYKLFECRGVVRADFLVQNAESENPIIYLNEINTIPGFLSYHLWMRTGIPYGALIEMLLTQAATDHKTALITTYKSDILRRNRALIDPTPN